MKKSFMISGNSLNPAITVRQFHELYNPELNSLLFYYSVRRLYRRAQASHFLRYKRKSTLTGDFYFKNGFWGFKNLHYKGKSGLSHYGLSCRHCISYLK